MRVFAPKISSIVTALSLLTGTATALTDTHTIGVLAYQGETEAIAPWEPVAQALSGQLAQAAKSQGNPLDDYEISLECICTQTHAK